ncbi:MAG: response regulator transcription factor [Burkholderiaceae bacterium]|nr:response regulator transcription factor [Burkholderiaceae bacterium]
MPTRSEVNRPVVLVVDDAPTSLGMLCDALEVEGYTVLIARDGEAALQRLELVSPDAILLDAVMPGLSGFDTCRQIKANPVFAHIPVIFMTGLSETPHVLEGFACGGVDYVVKPLRIQEVVARLQTHARNARITRLAREAVDVVGFGVLLVDTQERIAWRSPQATKWLETLAAVSPEQTSLPQGIRMALENGQADLAIGSGIVSVRNMGDVAMGETMLLLELQKSSTTAASRLSNAALTPRETEVLSWLAKGKTNRDIGEILGVSHRTVNKHLEHVFEKMGVETRSAAAALVSSAIV